MIANNKNFPLFNLQDTFLARKRSPSSNFITEPIENPLNFKKSKLRFLFIDSLINNKATKIEENTNKIDNNLKIIKNKSFDGPKVIKMDNLSVLSNINERSRDFIKPLEISNISRIDEFSIRSQKITNREDLKPFLSPKIARSENFSLSESKQTYKANKDDLKQVESAKTRSYKQSIERDKQSNDEDFKDFQQMEALSALNNKNKSSNDNISQFKGNSENTFSLTHKKSNSLGISKSKRGKVQNFEEKSKDFQAYLQRLNPTPIFNFKKSKHNKDKDFSNFDEDETIIKNDKGSKVLKNNGVAVLGGERKTLINRTSGVAGKIKDLAEKDNGKLREVGFGNMPAITSGTKNELPPSISSIKKSVFKRNLQVNINNLTFFFIDIFY